jgi:2-polyprenyl-3-methyl-5-hydroxy-6-metoxy-1,4-benzoquinol methylase
MNLIEDRKRNIFFYAHFTFESWDFTNPISKGIGGSEVSQIEMASRLAQRGHNVISYAPLPAGKGAILKHREVTWLHTETCTFKEKGIWIIYRCPEVLDNFEETHEDQTIWFVAQDTTYATLTEERAKKIDRFICLCTDHAFAASRMYPEVADKICISSNGISVDIIKSIEKDDNIVRDPHRMIYTSSPDRGLKPLLTIFKKAKEFIPELSLHVFYGFDNIDKVIEKFPALQKSKDEIMDIINTTPDIHWHGRIGQYELIKEWFKSNIWCYPINFTETSCISSMEAQACGVFPITAPKWALRENVMHGVLLESDIEDPLSVHRYVAEVIRMCRAKDHHSSYRRKMMMDARIRFNWERYVDKWENRFYNPNDVVFPNTQYAFQHKYSWGRILNVGCDCDSSDLKGKKGNVINLDVSDRNPDGTKRNADVIGDIRDANFVVELFQNFDKFDTIIVGDLLEHICYVDGVKALQNLRKLMYIDTRLVITCPADSRTIQQQREDAGVVYDIEGKMLDAYAKGCSYYHRYVSKYELIQMVTEAGLQVEELQEIDYTWFCGAGVIATL